MNGPRHYTEAERLLDHAHHFTYGDGGDPAVGLALATEAVGHARLAAAAATAMSASIDGDPDTGMPPADATAWHNACGVRPPAPAADPAQGPDEDENGQ